jgi:hypothetical protein
MKSRKIEIPISSSTVVPGVNSLPGANQETNAAGPSTSSDLFSMSDVEDYPGPSRNHSEKQGQPSEDRAKEEMVKPPARPESEKKKSERKRKPR